MVNTPLTQQMEAHKQLLDFVDHAQPGTRFALFANMAGLQHLVQGFTNDHELLRAAILSKGLSTHARMSSFMEITMDMKTLVPCYPT